MDEINLKYCQEVNMHEGICEVNMMYNQEVNKAKTQMKQCETAAKEDIPLQGRTAAANQDTGNKSRRGMNVMNSKYCQEVNMHEEINTHEDDQDFPTLVDDSDSDVEIKYNIELNKETSKKLPRTDKAYQCCKQRGQQKRAGSTGKLS